MPEIPSHHHCCGFVAIATSPSCHVGSDAKGGLNITNLSRFYLVAAGCADPVFVHVAMCLMRLRDH